MIYALGACFVWGLVFVIPLFMGDFSAMEVTVGRYLFFGLASALFFIKTSWQKIPRYSPAIWTKAVLFAFAGSFGYYPFVVLSLRYSTPAICALVSGVTPITLAVYSNWRQRESSYRHLILPSLLILTGLVMINAPYLAVTGEDAAATHVIGVVCAFVALASWTWFAATNAYFLKDNPEVHPGEWSTMIGVVTLGLVGIFLAVSGVFFSEHIAFDKYSEGSPELIKFFAGSAILGLICSWVGSYLWNLASISLPLLMVSQMLIFETIFGVLFAYIVTMQVPSTLEMLGISLLLIAIVYGARSFSAPPKETLA